MDNSQKFVGFFIPKANYFRLPNNWFDILADIRKQVGSRITSIVKVLEYIMRHTWSLQPQGGLTEAEIRKGKKYGRRRLDSGTQLDSRSISRAIELLVSVNLVLKVSNNTRGQPLYRINTEEPQNDETPFNKKEFQGFLFPETNYFKVPNSWTDITTDISSAATITLVEYLIRHGYGYQNQDGVFLDADEIGNGRRYKDGQRYDQGIQYDHSTVYHSLQEAIKHQLIVWTDRTPDGAQRRLYSIRMIGMPVSDELEYLGKLPWESDDEFQDWLLGVENKSSVEDEAFREDAEANRTNVVPIRVDASLNPANAENPNRIDANSIRENANLTRNDADTSWVSAGTNPDHAGETPIKDTLKTTIKETEENTPSTTGELPKDAITAAVVDGDLYQFLYFLDIDKDRRQEIAAKNPPLDYIFGWTLKVFTEVKKYTNVPGFLVTKFRALEAPPPQFLAFARLSVEDWLELLDTRSDWKIYGQQSRVSEYVADIAKEWMSFYLEDTWEKLPKPVREFLIKEQSTNESFDSG